MKTLSFITMACCLFATALICVAADNGASRVPVLLELFTSEGCSSCPPADRLLEILDQKQPVAGADLIVLSEHVDYWDRLGWKDPFSSSQYTARQQDYTNKYNFDGVYTPQLVVDGRFGLVGSDGREASSAIQKAIREQKIPIEISNVARDGNQVTAHIEFHADQSFKGGRADLVRRDRRQPGGIPRSPRRKRRAVFGARRRDASPQTVGHYRARQRVRERRHAFGSTRSKRIPNRGIRSRPQIRTRLWVAVQTCKDHY